MSFTNKQLELVPVEYKSLIEENAEHPQVKKIVLALDTLSEDDIMTAMSMLARTVQFEAKAKETSVADLFNTTVKVETAVFGTFGIIINGVYGINEDLVIGTYGVTQGKDLVGTTITWRPNPKSKSDKIMAMYVVDIEGLNSARIAANQAKLGDIRLTNNEQTKIDRRRSLREANGLSNVMVSKEEELSVN